MPFSTVGCHAAPLDLCLRSVLSGHSAQLYRLPRPTVQTATAGHRACRNKNQANTARGWSRPPAQISIALRRCPRFPSSGAFRRRPRRRRPTRIHPAAIW